MNGEKLIWESTGKCHIVLFPCLDKWIWFHFALLYLKSIPILEDKGNLNYYLIELLEEWHEFLFHWVWETEKMSWHLEEGCFLIWYTSDYNWLGCDAITSATMLWSVKISFLIQSDESVGRGTSGTQIHTINNSDISCLEELFISALLQAFLGGAYQQGPIKDTKLQVEGSITFAPGTQSLQRKNNSIIPKPTWSPQSDWNPFRKEK